jgi:hypothetical protein
MGRLEAPTAIQAVWPVPARPQASVRHQDRTEHGSPIAGVLVFCGIGLALTAIAAAFQWLELPPPYF